ncbi:MAG: VOC family protein [Verrucomicrobiota bacterium]|nr:VOC family protein [Verrucomicrobiota bacterium]
MSPGEFQVEHCGVAAADTTALKEWYAQVFGAEVVFVTDEAPPAYMIRFGGMQFEIYPSLKQIGDVQNNKLGGWRHIAIKVKSIEEARLHLERSGVRITEPIKPAGGGGRVLFFNDPEGNILHLVERPAENN